MVSELIVIDQEQDLGAIVDSPVKMRLYKSMVGQHLECSSGPLI